MAADTTFWIIFDDKGPDHLGRRSFHLEWIDHVHPESEPCSFCAEKPPRPGKAYNGFFYHLRGQCFFAVPRPEYLPGPMPWPPTT